MSSLVPFEPGREVGLVDSFRLKREARQRNAELERMSGQFTIEESRRHMGAVAREQQQQRDHRLALIGQGQTAERGARAISLTGYVVDLAIAEVAGDTTKATYIEPIVQAVGYKLRDSV